MIINTHHKRVIKAHYAKHFARKWLKVLFIFIGLSTVIISAGLIYLGIWFGWLLAVVPVLIIIVHEWDHHDLSINLPNINSTEPVLILSKEVLANINKSDVTPKDIFKAINKTNGFWFIANRLTLHPDIVSESSLSEDWWPKAVELYSQYPVKNGIDGAHILTALVLSSQSCNEILSASNNSEQDMLDGLGWYAYVVKTIDQMNKRQDDGGIAHDWAAGYTPMLDSYAQNVSRTVQYGGRIHRDVIGHTNVIEQMVSIFTSNGRANIALVGDTGSGKTTCIGGFAEALLFSKLGHGLQYSQIYQVDIAALLTRVPADKIEYTIQRICNEAYHAKNIVLYFDNAGAFFGGDGKADVTNIILPIIESGGVRMIFAFTPLQWQYLQREKSQIVALLNYQVVQPTNKDDTVRILENQALFTEAQYNCTFSYESLHEVYRLAERYGPEIAMPGRAISVLEDSGRAAQGSLVVKADVQKAVEQTTGIRIATADTAEKDVLLGLEQTLKQRVIGQDVAVHELVAALKRSRAGVANPNKPIGTFLFLGPTGVGKTEMSKTLASAYFGGDAGMVRVDMNEYITQDSVHKLLLGSSSYGTSFLETVRRQPFTVVLFDELEKAHSEIINTLLQLLDEGSIKDSDNRVVSFKDAIIIATSNAGADVIRQKISSGVSVQDLESTLADALIAKNVFKPEFINRFDDVIIFSPLNQEGLNKVVLIMLSDINKQLQGQGITVELTEDAITWLSNQGYDERLGARPLRRMMQKTVETVVSDVLLRQKVPHGSTITINSQHLAATLK
ncbi:MAG: ATP-dependent Clp protease ATP-binding subunit ClpC [Patescibacteria group bacterium]|nr:ATP-dependent Clp protease ATP-binding subunit ClpC [Patescibacteria group bacterium]